MGYIPGAEDIYHEKNGIIGKIHVKRYLADESCGGGGDQPRLHRRCAKI